ncbi:MAG: hypothetical protein MI725_05935, partial [Pirellulales bacterium]|nr:hypothetical protein [Pirellulales bacterium]
LLQSQIEFRFHVRHSVPMFCQNFIGFRAQSAQSFRSLCRAIITIEGQRLRFFHDLSNWGITGV